MGWKCISQTLFVTALANLLSGPRSCELHRKQQYIRSISIATATGEAYASDLPADAGDCSRLVLSQRLLFLCSLVGGFGLWIEYVMKSARDRCKSAEK
mgnify:CR=1 FL=1